MIGINNKERLLPFESGGGGSFDKSDQLPKQPDGQEWQPGSSPIHPQLGASSFPP